MLNPRCVSSGAVLTPYIHALNPEPCALQETLKKVGTSVARLLSKEVEEVEVFLCQQLCFRSKGAAISWDTIEHALRPTAASDAVRMEVSALSLLTLPRVLTLLDFINK